MSADTLKTTLGLDRPPIAIAFLDAPPPQVLPWKSGEVPAGCTFWRAAMDGGTFYTVPSDHYNCAVGAHTHAIQQPEGRAHVLNDTVGFMVSQGYLEMAEVPSIPTWSKAPNYVAYGPMETAPFRPDVVLIAAKPAAAMLLYEIALRAGAASAVTNILGRPGCAVLPLTQAADSTCLSFGCKGNRIFTGLPDDEMYICIPGSRWDAVLAQAHVLRQANDAMERHYAGHKALFPIMA